MTIGKEDLAILDKFGFEIPPVGVKFTIKRPDEVERLDKVMTLCEMLRYAQDGNAFYADNDNHTCDAGLYILGQEEIAEPYYNGQYGTGLGIFESPRTGTRLYQHVPKIDERQVHYIMFSPLDKLNFEPDVLVITANNSQAEILLRASSYKTGSMWNSKYTAAIGCAWLLVYPYLYGEMNYVPTGLGFGMRRRKLYPEGLFLMSFPFDTLPPLMQTLEEMPWVPEPYKPDGLIYINKMRRELGLDSDVLT
jgi:uncharacterized protein (DUF169 family)